MKISSACLQETGFYLSLGETAYFYILFSPLLKKSSLSMFEMGGACRTYGGGERCIVLVGKPEGKRPLGRSSER